ncbi:MAG: inositol monophosphatase family protein, partial [Acidobacteriota bacterium]
STKRLQVPPEAQPDRMIAAMSRSHSLPVVNAILGSLGVNRQIQSGSVGLKMGMLAEGVAHIYLHPAQRTSIWDTCGPEAILRAAGGVVTDIYGDPLRYVDPTVRNQRGIVASNGQIHDQIIRAIAATLTETEARS